MKKRFEQLKQIWDTSDTPGEKIKFIFIMLGFFIVGLLILILTIGEIHRPLMRRILDWLNLLWIDDLISALTPIFFVLFFGGLFFFSMHELRRRERERKDEAGGEDSVKANEQLQSTQLEYQDLQSKEKPMRKARFKKVVFIISVVFVLFYLFVYLESHFALRWRWSRAESMQSIAAGERSAIKAYLHLDVLESETEMDRIGSILLAHPEVSEIVYVTAQEVLEEFIEAHFEPDCKIAIHFREIGLYSRTYHFRVYIHRREASTFTLFTLFSRNDYFWELIYELSEFAEGIEGVRAVSHMRR